MSDLQTSQSQMLSAESTENRGVGQSAPGGARGQGGAATRTGATRSGDLPAAVNELKAAEEAIHAASQLLPRGQAAGSLEPWHYQDLLNFIPEPVFMTDPAGLVLEANRATSTILTHARLYILGKPLAMIVAPDEQGAFIARLAALRVLAGDWTREWDVSLRSKQAVSAISARVRVAPVRSKSGSVAGLRWLFRDVTARRMEAETAAAREQADARRLQERLADLEATVKLQAQLLTAERLARETAESMLAGKRAADTGPAPTTVDGPGR